MKGRMIVPNDITGIVRKIVFNDLIKKCNREYHDTFRPHVYCDGAITLRKHNTYYINYRYILADYREEIVCFKTSRQTMYKVPNNY